MNFAIRKNVFGFIFKLLLSLLNSKRFFMKLTSISTALILGFSLSAYAGTQNGLQFTHYNCSAFSTPLYNDDFVEFPSSQDSYPGEYFAKLYASNINNVERSLWTGNHWTSQWKIQDAQGRNAWIEASALCPL